MQERLLTQKVHVGIWYVLRVQAFPDSYLKAQVYTKGYVDPLGNGRLLPGCMLSLDDGLGVRFEALPRFRALGFPNACKIAGNSLPLMLQSKRGHHSGAPQTTSCKEHKYHASTIQKHPVTSKTLISLDPQSLVMSRCGNEMNSSTYFHTSCH